MFDAKAADAGGFSIVASPPEAMLGAAETALGAPLTLTLTPPATGATVSYVNGQDWLGIDLHGATIVLTPNAASLSAGTYTAHLHLSGETPQETDVMVTLVVTPGIAVPATISVTLGAATAASELTGSFPVGAADGVTLPPWSASSDTAWLVLDTSTGAATESVRWHIDPAVASALQNQLYRASIVVRAGPSLSRTSSVELNKQLPTIASIDRLALLANQPGTLAIYGLGLGGFANPGVAVRVGGAAVDGATAVSDRMIQASVPALPAGEYDVSLVGPSGIGTPAKTLSVLAPVDRTSQVVPTEGNKGPIVWDALQQSAFVMNKDLTTVMRFDLSGPTATIIAKRLAGLHNVGLNRDHSILLVTDSDGTLYDLDLRDLSTIRTRALNAFAEPTPFPLFVTGDNLAWLGTNVYDLDREQMVNVFDPNVRYDIYTGPYTAISPDGRRLLMSIAIGISPPPPVLYRDTAQGGYINPFSFSTPITNFVQAATDRDGERWILGTDAVRGFDLYSLGALAVVASSHYVKGVLSHDGHRAYVYSQDDSGVTKPRIFVFDLTGTLVTTTSFPNIGAFDMSDTPGCGTPVGSASCSADGVSFAITDDDRTLLAVGGQAFIVAPIPPEFRSP